MVAASAVTGHVTVDRERDRLVTPLVYMTEVERSVEVGKVTHLRIRRYPDEEGGGSRDGALFAVPRGEISDRALPTWEDRRAMATDPDAADEVEEAAQERSWTASRQGAARTRAQYP